jgi:hypothetical protein
MDLGKSVEYLGEVNGQLVKVTGILRDGVFFIGNAWVVTGGELP